MSGCVQDAITRYRIRSSRRWLIPAALWEIGIGIGTMWGLAGEPDDAPHLHIPQDVRGVMWITFASLALYAMLFCRRTDLVTRCAASLLAIMTTVRAMSYSVAFWLYETGQDAGGLGPWWSEGSPTAWYGSIPWWMITWAIVSQAVEWDVLRSAVRRSFGGFRRGGS